MFIDIQENSQLSQKQSISSLIVCAANNRECIWQLGEAMESLNDDEVTTILQEHLDVRVHTHTHTHSSFIFYVLCLQESSDNFSLSQALSLLTAVSTSSPSLSTTHTLTSLLLPSPPHPLPNEDLVSKLLFYLTISLPVDKYAIFSYISYMQSLLINVPIHAVTHMYIIHAYIYMYCIIHSAYKMIYSVGMIY